MMRTAEDLLQELLSLDESHRIEAKRCAKIDRSVMETVCAFANEPGLGGGYLLLGVARDSQDLFSNAYVVEGIADPDKLQSDLASQCSSVFNRPVRPRVSVENLRGKAVVVRELGAIDNAAYRSINRTDTLNASGHLRRIRDLGLLEMMGSGSRTYYVPAASFTASLGQIRAEPLSPSASPTLPASVDSTDEANSRQDSANSHQVEQNSRQVIVDSHHLWETVPDALKARVPIVGSKPRREVLRVLIEDLCRWRPLSARELASVLRGREHKPLVRDYLTPMVSEGVLAYTIPEMENHPDQRYTIPSAANMEAGP